MPSRSGMTNFNWYEEKSNNVYLEVIEQLRRDIIDKDKLLKENSEHNYKVNIKHYKETSKLKDQIEQLEKHIESLKTGTI